MTATTLVTGAAGFIGAHVCRELRARGAHVVGLDNYNDYYDPRMKRDRVAALCPDIEIAALDLTDGAGLAQLFDTQRRRPRSRRRSSRRSRSASRMPINTPSPWPPDPQRLPKAKGPASPGGAFSVAERLFGNSIDTHNDVAAEVFHLEPVGGRRGMKEAISSWVPGRRPRRRRPARCLSR